MTKALVTGAAGFVGRHLCHRLLSLGWMVDAVDAMHPLSGAIHPQHGWPLFEPRDYTGFHFIERDCRVFFRERRDLQYDYVFHLAAIVGGRLVIEHDPIRVAEDLALDAELWTWALDAKPGKIIIFSSSAVYPIKYQTRFNHVSLSEGMVDFSRNIDIPDMTYGWAKLTLEYLTETAFRKHEIDSVIYRPFSGVGEDQDETYPFPAICRRILSATPGSDVAVWGSGQQMRDFIHIDDCIDAVVSTMDQIGGAKSINLSSGVATTFLGLAEAVAAIAGKSVRVVPQTDKPEGVFARIGDTARQSEYGIGPRISLDQAIERTLRFLSDGRSAAVSRS